MLLLGFWDPCWMSVFDIHIVDKDVESYDERHPHKILSQQERHKRGIFLEAWLKWRRPYVYLVLSVYGLVWEETKAKTKQLVASLSKNGIGNNLQHGGMSGPIYPWTFFVSSNFWCRDHWVASPRNQDLCHRKEQSNKYWRRGEFRYLYRAQRQRIWVIWVLLGGYRYGSFCLGEFT